jgi:hypothetical protein
LLKLYEKANAELNDCRKQPAQDEEEEQYKVNIVCLLFQHLTYSLIRAPSIHIVLQKKIKKSSSYFTRYCEFKHSKRPQMQLKDASTGRKKIIPKQ